MVLQYLQDTDTGARRWGGGGVNFPVVKRHPYLQVILCRSSFVVRRRSC